MFINGAIIDVVASLIESVSDEEAWTIPDVPRPVSCESDAFLTVMHKDAKKPPANAFGCIASLKIKTS